jgi:hypothetical protein
MDRISKRELRAALGVETDAEVAAFYDISPAAVSQWGEDAPIPELRQLQAGQREPDRFTPEAISEVRLRLRTGAAAVDAAPSSPSDMSEAA